MFSHYHWDHILGLTLSPPTFIDCIPMTMYGPVDSGTGPKDVVDYIFSRPFFPVDSSRIRSKMSFKAMPDFDVSVIAIHPEGGFRLMTRDIYLKMLKKGQISFQGGKQHHSSAECLVITMQPTNHSNSRCISYRFEENPTGKVFVFCTDHEDEAALATDFKQHMSGADLLVIDAQYNKDKYEQQTARFGHGTPGGVVKLAQGCGIRRLGITHHDPRSSDDFLDETILGEARASINPETTRTGTEAPLNVFLCRDYEEHEV
jgi:ribonuclease BN (tRNA processing enzyme)